MHVDLNFSALDRQFGDFVERVAGERTTEVRLAAMLASRYRAEGHICVPLREVAGTPLGEFVAPPATSWTKKLRASAAVGSSAEFTPLLLDEKDRLYLRRYWEYEQELARTILARAAGARPEVDEQLLERGLEALFPSAGSDGADWQKIAALTAVTNNLCVITGGPGTGKTRTVVAILALLLEQRGGEQLRVALAAPTGKAAARLSESIRGMKESVPASAEARARLPEQATTIHRLLGTIPDSPYFRHNKERPLLADVVVVDEASMVDLALMAKLVAAVPETSRLILLGDKDQLASVEAGNVLADICNTGNAADGAGSPLRECIVELQRNYRFAETGAIYRLSAAVNRGDATSAAKLLKPSGEAEVTWRTLPAARGLAAELHHHVVRGFRTCLGAESPATALAALQQFRILCAVRKGAYGVEQINALAEEILADAGLLTRGSHWYPGRPVMITRNDYNLGLFNGDTGLILSDAESGGELRAFFLSAEGSLRRFLPTRLPLRETAFAITVHKSQGSEFERLLLILPEKDTPVLTRELLYTGITRARSGVEIWSNEEVFRAAVARPTERTSGLREALWQPAERKQLHQSDFGF